jgi:hypothetical protein
VIGSNTIFYTPKVVNSPRQIDQDIQGWRNRLRAIPLEALYREEEPLLELARQEDAANKEAFFRQVIETGTGSACCRSICVLPLSNFLYQEYLLEGEALL